MRWVYKLTINADPDMIEERRSAFMIGVSETGEILVPRFILCLWFEIFMPYGKLMPEDKEI